MASLKCQRSLAVDVLFDLFIHKLFEMVWPRLGVEMLQNVAFLKFIILLVNRLIIDLLMLIGQIIEINSLIGTILVIVVILIRTNDILLTVKHVTNNITVAKNPLQR